MANTITAPITVRQIDISAPYTTARDAYQLSMLELLAAGVAEEDLPTRAEWAESLNGVPVELQKSATHVQWRLLGGDTWTDLVALADITGVKGDAGVPVELNKSGTHIQWRLVGAGTWIDLVLLADIEGGKGDKGDDGVPVELNKSGTHIQWRLVGSGTWLDLVPLADIKGEAGTNGKQVMLQKSATHIQWKYDTDVAWTDLVLLSDLRGAAGSDATVTLSNVSSIIPAASLTTFADADVISVKQLSGGLLASMSITNFKSWVATWLTKVANLIGDAGIGALPYMSGKDTTALLPPNTATSKKFLSQTGTGSAGQAPAWAELALGDVSGAVGGWQRVTSSSYVAVKGGRYILDVSAGGVTLSDISSPQDGDSFEFMVYSAGVTYAANVGGTARDESTASIVRRYVSQTSSWKESFTQVPWEKKTGNFTPMKGGRYKVTASLTIVEGSATGFTTDDIYEFVIVNSTSTVTIGSVTFTSSNVSTIRRCTGSTTSFESLPTLIGAYIYKTSYFTAEAGKGYLVVGSSVSVSDPSGSAGQSYTVVVAGSSSSATIGGTICYESSLPVVRRNTGVYANGSYWVNVPFTTPTAFYSAGSQASTWYPVLANGLSQTVTPSSSGSWTLGAPQSGASDGKVLKIYVTGYSGGNSLYFSSLYMADSGGVGYISTPITLAANKKYYFEFTYLGSSWILTNHRGPIT